MNPPSAIIRHLHWYDTLAIITAVVMLALLALNTMDYVHNRTPENPLEYRVPQELLGSDIIPVGGTLSINRIKCNSSSQPIAIEGQGSFYRRVDIVGQYEVSTPRGNILIIPANSCEEAVFSGPLPLTVTPGVWIRQGVDCTVDQVTRWCASWYTERFTVVGN